MEATMLPLGCIWRIVNNMKNENEIFEIISNAGDAYSFAFQALDAVEERNYEEAERLLAEGRKIIIKAHQTQTNLLFNECSDNSGSSQVSLLMVHSQDHLMNAMLMLDLTEKMISLFKSRDSK